jgi:hypothetical protein
MRLPPASVASTRSDTAPDVRSAAGCWIEASVRPLPLLSGFTDEAIARQLGTSHRTVQRRVAALMADLGAQTRFQVGVRAAVGERRRSQEKHH